MFFEELDYTTLQWQGPEMLNDVGLSWLTSPFSVPWISGRRLVDWQIGVVVAIYIKMGSESVHTAQLFHRKVYAMVPEKRGSD